MSIHDPATVPEHFALVRGHLERALAELNRAEAAALAAAASAELESANQILDNAFDANRDARWFLRSLQARLMRAESEAKAAEAPAVTP